VLVKHNNKKKFKNFIAATQVKLRN